MARQANLREIGLEGFTAIDMLYCPNRKSGANAKGVFPARQGRWVVQVPNDEMEEPAAVNHYGGIMAVNHGCMGKPQNRRRRLTKI